MSSGALAQDPRNYLAEERTFLAWIRTGLAVSAFGFVVARFGLFLNALVPLQGSHLEPSGFSPAVGISLVVIGVLVNVLASWRHAKHVQALRAAGLTTEAPSTAAIVLALSLAIVGAALAVYLIAETLGQGAPRAKEQVSMLAGDGIISWPSSRPV